MPLEIRAYVVALLNQTLACTVDLRSQVKQAVWNIRGPDVFLLQTLFATIAAELDGYTDLVAERIAALGGVVQGTARMAVSRSTLPDYSGDLVEGTTHVLALAERFAHYDTAIRANITHATDVEDTITAHLYTEISRGIEKRLGGLDAHLHR
jgi:starvation-inducible DNA-binding protein